MIFVLILRESLLKSPKITLKKIVKCILRYRKTINSPKNSFREKQLCKEWFAHIVVRTARSITLNNNTHGSFLLLVNKFKSLLLNLRSNTHVNCCWVMYALSRRLGRIVKLTIEFDWASILAMLFISIKSNRSIYHENIAEKAGKPIRSM